VRVADDPYGFGFAEVSGARFTGRGEPVTQDLDGDVFGRFRQQRRPENL